MEQTPTPITPETPAVVPPVTVGESDALDFDRWIDTQGKGAVETTPDPPAVDTPAAPAAAAESQTPPVEIPAEEPAEPEPDPASDAGRTLAKHKRSMQARLDSEVGKRSQAERDALAAKDRVIALEQQLDALRTKPAETPATPAAPAVPAPGVAYQTPADDLKPKQEDFQDADDPYLALTEATARWAARDEGRRQAHESAQRTAADRARIDADTAARQSEELVTKHTARLTTFRQTHPDFDAVIANPEAKTTDVMNYVMGTTDSGPAVAYFLGRNPLESQRIAKLPAGAQIFELGHLAARLAVAPSGPTSGAESTSQAPPPIKPVAGNATPLTRPLENLSTDEYIEQMNSQGARR